MTTPITDRQRELLRRFFDIWDRKTPEEQQQIIRDAIPHGVIRAVLDKKVRDE